jgi:predicted methyltransferase
MNENKLIEKDNKYYIENKGKLEKVAIFTDHYYSLKPWNGIPLLEIDGIRMHLVKEFKDPLQYSKEVVKHIKFNGKETVFDTCTGLGYLAIEESKKAKKVITCEIRKEVLQLAKLNPYSKELFNKEKIDSKNKSSFDFIKTLDNESIDVVMHDPPKLALSPDLYSYEFYNQVFRILKPNGQFFHYIGTIGIHKGKRFELDIIKKLEQSGFKNCKYYDKLQAIICKK